MFPPRFRRIISVKATEYHGRLPVIRRLPLPVIGVILILAVANTVVWVAVGIVLVRMKYASVDLATVLLLLIRLTGSTSTSN